MFGNVVWFLLSVNFLVNAEESADLTKVIVKLVIPNLTMQKSLFGHPKPKPGVSDVDVKFDTQSLEVTAAVTFKGNTTKYHYKVNKLPGVIHPDKCTIEYKKEQIILTLIKQEVSTWAVMLSKNGLEQAPSD